MAGDSAARAARSTDDFRIEVMDVAVSHPDTIELADLHPSGIGNDDQTIDFRCVALRTCQGAVLVDIIHQYRYFPIDLSLETLGGDVLLKDIRRALRSSRTCSGSAPGRSFAVAPSTGE